MKLIFIIILIIFNLNFFAQRSKDGSVTISSPNTIVNAYTPLTNNVSIGSTTINVVNSSSFSVGDLIYIIQMQGASVNAYDGGTTGPWYDSNSALPTDTSFGRVINYNNSGLHEFAQVSSIPNSTSIVIDCGLKNNYDVSKNFTTASGKNITLLGHVQIIKVPRYSSLTINGSGSISCPQWNGNIGGVIVIEVENNTVINSIGSINASGKGFRGGAFKNIPILSTGGDKFGSSKSTEGAYKGESIAGDTGFYRNYAAVYARGAIANGGGGGCVHNSGGGGGANGGNLNLYNGKGNPVSGYTTIWNLESLNFSANTSSGGGRGGYTFSANDRTLNTTAAGNTTWGGDNRRNMGGFGGRPLYYNSGRLFLGGGGGAGDGNDNQAGAGGNGGGLIYLVCYGNLSGTGTILADGGNGSSTSIGCSSNDGAGGGGGGGTIVLNVNGTINLPTSNAVSAKGGNGGNVNYNCIFLNSTAYGPGASGGGGYIASSSSIINNNVSGGNNGIVTGNSSNIANQFPPNGATSGGLGQIGTITNYSLFTSPNPTLCTNQSFSITAHSSDITATINWFNSNSGGSPIATGTVYASNGYSTAGSYTIYAGSCQGTYRQPIIITVSTGLNISTNNPNICSNQSTTLTAIGATSYTWNNGANTNSIVVSPTITTTYSVDGSNGLCNGSTTSTVTVLPTPTISVNSSSICLGQQTTLVATGANTYTWSTNQINSSIIVSPLTTSTYSVIGTSINGCITNYTTSNVYVASITPSFTGYQTNTISVGETLNLVNNSSNASNILWQYCNGSSTNNQILITANDTGTCCVKLIASNAFCIDSINSCFDIINEFSINIPNVFTPNGDGKNDVFKIDGSGIKNFNCIIYNRWGIKLYEWFDIKGYWDGNTKNGKAPNGTYFYILNYNNPKGEITSEKGFLTLFTD